METIHQLKRDDDLADLINLSREFFAEYEAHHKQFFDIDGLEDAHITGYFTRTIDSDNEATFVAMQDRRTVGYITVHVRPQAEFYRVDKVGAISGLYGTERAPQIRDWHSFTGQGASLLQRPRNQVLHGVHGGNQ